MSPQPEHGIYCIRNMVNGKCYVGSAIDIQARFYNHRWHLDRGTHKNPRLSRAWRKYGEAAFLFEVLEIVDDIERLIEREQTWIDALNSHRKGYNAKPQADSNLGRRFGKRARKNMAKSAQRAMNDPEVKEWHRHQTRAAMRSPEVRRRTSEAARQRWADPAYREKMTALRRSPEYRKRVDPNIRKSVQAVITAMTPEERLAYRALQAKSAARSYVITAPNGKTFKIKNLKKFCRQKGIPYDSAMGVLKGRMSQARGHSIKKSGAAI